MAFKRTIREVDPNLRESVDDLLNLNETEEALDPEASPGFVDEPEDKHDEDLPAVGVLADGVESDEDREEGDPLRVTTYSDEEIEQARAILESIGEKLPDRSTPLKPLEVGDTGRWVIKIDKHCIKRREAVVHEAMCRKCGFDPLRHVISRRYPQSGPRYFQQAEDLRFLNMSPKDRPHYKQKAMDALDVHSALCPNDRRAQFLLKQQAAQRSRIF